MSRDYYDFLIDQLLRESLGGDRPRDLTSRVLERAKSHDRTRRNWWLSAGAAIAAGIAVAVSLWVFMPRQYPAPVPRDLFVFGNDIGPGTKFESPDDSSGSLTLGGYVDMSVAPNTTFTLGGGPRFQERVILEGGHLDVATRKKGTFQLVVGPATVQVSNTRLGVDVSDAWDEIQQRFMKHLSVKVLEGSAVVSGVENPGTLRAGDARTFTVSDEMMPRFVQTIEPQKSPTPLTPTTPNRRGSALRRVAPNGEAPGTAQIQVIIGPGPYPLDGILRHLGPQYYFLQTDHGNFFMGTKETLPKDAPEAGAASYVHVVFGKGRVERMDAIPALPTPTLQPTPNAIPTFQMQRSL